SVVPSSELALVLDVDPIPVERQIREQGRPAEPIVNLDIAKLGVPEAAEQPEDEVDRRQREGDIFHELRQLEWPTEVRLVPAQKEIADQHGDEGNRVADIGEA